MSKGVVNIFATGEVHCQYCMCPKEVWKHTMKTYDGDECKLYDDFTNVIWKLEEEIKPFNNQDIIERCRKDFGREYTDIKDFEAAINEMIEINYSEGYMPKNYRRLSVCR